MRRLVLPTILLSAFVLHAGDLAQPKHKHKRMRWLRRIGSAEVSLGERISAIRLRGSSSKSAEVPVAPVVQAARN
jgi:hypothetical protein